MTVLFMLSCLAGSFIQTVSGFGFGIFVLSVFPFFLPSTGAGVAISGLLSMTQSGVVSFRLRNKIGFRMIIPPLLGFFATAAAVIFLFADKPDQMLKRMLAVVLVLMSLYFMFFSQRVKVRANMRNGFIFGGLGGILGGLFGMGGPPMVVYLLSACEDDSERYMGSIQFYFAVTNLYSSVMRVFAGIIDSFVLQHWLLGLAAVFLGVFIGRKVFSKISAKNLRRMVYGFMAISGVAMFFQ